MRPRHVAKLTLFQWRNFAAKDARSFVQRTNLPRAGSCAALMAERHEAGCTRWMKWACVAAGRRHSLGSLDTRGLPP